MFGIRRCNSEPPLSSILSPFVPLGRGLFENRSFETVSARQPYQNLIVRSAPNIAIAKTAHRGQFLVEAAVAAAGIVDVAHNPGGV